MRVQMIVTISGTFNGRRRPPAGEIAEVEETDGRALIAAGLAVEAEVTDSPAGEIEAPTKRNKRKG